METSSRTLTIACATLLLAAVSVRGISNSMGAENSTSTPGPAKTVRPIPDSDFSILNQYGTVKVPQLKLGTKNEDLIKLDQAGAIVPGVTKVEDDRPATNPPQTMSEEDSGPSLTEESSPSAESSEWPWDNPARASKETSDSGLLDLVLSSMNDKDRTAFRMTWATLSPDQRQAVLNSLRASTNSMQDHSF